MSVCQPESVPPELQVSDNDRDGVLPARGAFRRRAENFVYIPMAASMITTSNAKLGAAAAELLTLFGGPAIMVPAGPTTGASPVPSALLCRTTHLEKNMGCVGATRLLVCSRRDRGKGPEVDGRAVARGVVAGR